MATFSWQQQQVQITVNYWHAISIRAQHVTHQYLLAHLAEQVLFLLSLLQVNV